MGEAALEPLAAGTASRSSFPRSRARSRRLSVVPLPEQVEREPVAPQTDEQERERKRERESNASMVASSIECFFSRSLANAKAVVEFLLLVITYSSSGFERAMAGERGREEEEEEGEKEEDNEGEEEKRERRRRFFFLRLEKVSFIFSSSEAHRSLY
jgi:hypothetical protein